MITVVGGTGRLGSRVVRRLGEHDEVLRVLARRIPDGLPADVEVVTGDVCDADARRRAVAGARVVVSSVTGFPDRSPDKVDRAGNSALFDEAAAVGADVVFVSHGWSGEPRHVPRTVLHIMGLVPGKGGRMARASLAMDDL